MSKAISFFPFALLLRPIYSATLMSDGMNRLCYAKTIILLLFARELSKGAFIIYGRGWAGKIFGETKQNILTLLYKN